MIITEEGEINKFIVLEKHNFVALFLAQTFENYYSPRYGRIQQTTN